MVAGKNRVPTLLSTDNSTNGCGMWRMRTAVDVSVRGE